MRYGDVQIEETTELRNLVAGTPINKKVGLTVWRNGKKTHVSVVIKESPG